MTLPVSFDEVSYFKNHFRGDLIVTKNVIYYFPHTNVEADKHKKLGGADVAAGVGAVGSLLIPAIGALPWAHGAASLGFRFFKFGRRTFHPTTNRPKIKERKLWRGVEPNEELQKRLDAFIAEEKKTPIDISAENSLPKPMRFEKENVKKLKLGLKLRFDTEFDSHDFGFNLMHKKYLRNALQEAGFLK